MNENFDFESEFENDNEVDEMLDALTLAVAEAAEVDDRRLSIINPYKIQSVIYTYKVLKYLTKGTKAKVTYEMHEPYRSMGSVSVVGNNLTFKRTDWFMKAVELASNVDIYPKTNGTVQIDFTFHGLTRPLE